MPEDTSTERVSRWLAEHFGGRVTEIARQPRWRPAWLAEVETGDARHSLYVRGERLDARIGFTLQHEMRLQRLLGERGIPVARVHGWIDEPAAYVMDRVAGAEHFGEATAAERDAVMDAYMAALARIHALEVGPFAEAGILRAEAPADSGRIGMQVYERAYRAAKKRPDPFLEFALGWLHRNPLAGATRESVVLWDTGQFLQAGGRLQAIIDLEIGHIGDPMMDLAGFRMRAREIGFGDFDRLYAVYEAGGGHPVDRAAIEHHYFSFALCNQLAFHAALAEPPAGSDYMMNLRWCVETNLYAIEALAARLAIDLEPVPSLEPRRAPVAAAHAHLVDALRRLGASAGGQEHEVRNAFRLARHLQRASEIGAAAEAADLADLEALLGHRPPDWEEGDAALERFVVDAGDADDAALVRIFHRRLHRALATLGPAGSAIARHHPVAGF